jgi:hypothetical protein
VNLPVEEDSPLPENETIQPKNEEMNYHDSEKVEPVIERVRKSMVSKT